MNGDLSLSQALGGLRIANPDDVAPSPPQELSAERDSSTTNNSRPSTHQQHLVQSFDQSITTSTSASQSTTHSPSFPPTTPHTPVLHDRTSRNFPNEASPYLLNLPPSSPINLHPLDPISPSTDIHHPRQHASQTITATPSAANMQLPPASRPVSGVYFTSLPADSDQFMSPYSALRAEPTRSSVYGVAVAGRASRSESASLGPLEAPRPYSSSRNGPLPPPSGMLPQRSSSKGMAGGYTSMSGLPHGPPPPSGGYGPEVPLPASSEEWKDRGAAVGYRREVDVNGNTVIRSVKKGVRDFTFGRVLGEGSYSTVYHACDRQNLHEYAVKVLEKKHIIKEKKIKYVNIEKNTLNRLTEHPGIVRLYYTFQDEASLYYVLDLCNGGELLNILKKTGTFDIECTRFYGAQILDAIEYMHSRGVIHRDLKPENVLLNDNMHVKITDFGTAKLLPDPRDPRSAGDLGGSSALIEDGRAASFVGTAEYVSPELLTNKTAGKASDLWAYGCVIFQLLAGRRPFKATTEYLTFQKIVNLEYEFPANFPPAARDLVERLLVLEPVRRMTIEHIKNHEFFDGQIFGKELWRMKAPRLRPYVPLAQESHVIQLNGMGTGPESSGRGPLPVHMNGARPPRVITEMPPPTQLDIEWSPVLTRNNERILRLGDLMVTSSPILHNPHGKGEQSDGHKKLSRFFGGSTTKKRQRLVMITSGGRIFLAPAGGEDKRSKQEISLLPPDCRWKSHIDAKGQVVWCVDTNGVHYTFEEVKGTLQQDSPRYTVDEWLESLEKARDMAFSQEPSGAYQNDNGFGEMPSSMSSPASTLGGRANFPDGKGVSDRSSRNLMGKGQASVDEGAVKRNRFSKRQSKSGLGPAF